MEKETVMIEIGPNLAGAIKKMTEALDRENDRRSIGSINIGKQLKEAFGLDLTAVAIEKVRRGCSLMIGG